MAGRGRRQPDPAGRWGRAPRLRGRPGWAGPVPRHQGLESAVPNPGCPGGADPIVDHRSARDRADPRGSAWGCPRRQDISRRGGSDRRRPALGRSPAPDPGGSPGAGDGRRWGASGDRPEQGVQRQRAALGQHPRQPSRRLQLRRRRQMRTSPAPAGPERTRHHSVTCTYAFRRCMDPATNSADPPLISGRRDTPARSRSASPTHRRPAPRPAPSTGYAQQGSSLARRKPRSHPEGSTQRASWPPRPETGPGPGFDRARVVGCVPVAAGVVDGRR